MRLPASTSAALSGALTVFPCTVLSDGPGGFEGFFQAVADAKLDVPKDLAAIEEIGRRYHLKFLGTNPLAK